MKRIGLPLSISALAICTAFSLAGQAQSRSQIGMPVIPIATQPGNYTFNNSSTVQVQALDYSKLFQQQDRAAYDKASKDAYTAYTTLYGACASTDYKSCTGFQQLRQIYTQTSQNQIPMVPSIDLSNAINAFNTSRDLFIQSLAGMETLSEVWSKLGDKQNSAASPETRQVYTQGSLNLKVVGDAYRSGINDLVMKASGYVYKYNNGTGLAAVTSPGMGLELPTVGNNLANIQATLESMKAQLILAPNEKLALKIMHLSVVKQLVNFIGANGQHFVWYTNQQTQDMKDWVESVQNKSRLEQWARAMFCMPIGVPGLEIEPTKKFNLGYLPRGVDDSQFRLTSGVEFSSDNIRPMLSRLDFLIQSVASQAGEYNNVGGAMGYINQINSALTWHNEVSVNLSTMRILREGMQDELDVISGDEEGCARVRNRYYAKYQSLKDPNFAQKVIGPFFEGLVINNGGDYALQSFNDAGKVILPHGAMYLAVLKYRKEHPETSLVNQIFKDAGDDVK